MLDGMVRQGRKEDGKVPSDSDTLFSWLPPPNTHTYQHIGRSPDLSHRGCATRAILFPSFLSACKAEPFWTQEDFSSPIARRGAERGPGQCCPGVIMLQPAGKATGPSCPYFQFLVPIGSRINLWIESRRVKKVGAS